MSKDCPFGTAYLLGYLPQWYAGPVINLLGSVPINHADMVWQLSIVINIVAAKLEATNDPINAANQHPRK